jgi:ADP-heptose:LPS heptosyltransferase
MKPPQKLPVSVCIVAGNEAHRIRRALDSVQDWTSEIILAIDDKVTDGTDKIAETCGAKIVSQPWRVFAGNLNLTQLAAVIQHSVLHFCGNTGALHLAVMSNTPTVAWFWPDPSARQWMPVGEKYRVIVGENEPGTQFLGRIATDDLIAAAQAILKSA